MSERLPVEILSCIFSHLSSSATPDEKDLHAPSPPWCPILHVCTWWRQVALQTKDLWCLIPFGHPEWAKMALRLSRPRTISINFPSIPCDDEQPSKLHDAAVLALSEGSRAYRIHLIIRSRDVPSHDSRLLQGLKEIVPDELLNLRLEGHGTVIFLNETTLSFNPHQLKSLSLDHCVLSPCPNLFPVQLTTLRLLCCGLLSNFTFSMLIDTIQSLQNLTTLEILGTVLTGPDEVISVVEHDRPRVLLPHLKVFKIESDLALIRAYISNIDAPLSCDLLLTSITHERHDIPTSVSEIVRHLAQLLVPRMVSAIDTLGMKIRISFTEPANKRYRGDLDVTVRKDLPVSGRYESSSCTFEWDPSLERYPTLSRLLTLVPGNTAIAAVYIFTTLDASEWQTLRSLLPRVEIINFVSPRHTIYFPLAYYRLSQQEMPRLRNITISDNGIGPETSQPTEPSFPAIRSILENTSSWVDFAVTMHFSKSWPTTEDRTILSSYGMIIDWGGDQHFSRKFPANENTE